MTHGGPRPGAGRPRGRKVTTVSITPPPALLEAVTQAAKAEGVSRSRYIAKVLERLNL